MSQTTVNVRMDEDLKKDFDGVCNELGITMSTAIIMLAKKMTREKRIPFEVSIDPILLGGKHEPSAEIHRPDGAFRRISNARNSKGNAGG